MLPGIRSFCQRDDIQLEVMRVLFLSQLIPYPPDAGPKVKTWQVLRYLAGQGHRITLVSFSRPGDEQHLPTVRQVCERVYPVPIRRSRLADGIYWLRGLVSGRPFLVERDDQAGMRAAVSALARTERFDVIHADQLTMAQFALAAGEDQSKSGAQKPFLVFDAHNAVWTIVERMRQNSPPVLRGILALEARRVKQYEGQLVRRFDRTLAVTDLDRQALQEAVALDGKDPRAGQKITVIPIAIDTDQLSPVTRRPNSADLLTLGTLHYPPNADGIRWFAREVFPLVRQARPGVTLTIVGKNPPADFRQLAAQPGGAVTVTGYVPDLTPYLEQCALVVIPVRAGGGMRVRILEAFSRAIPVVTTAVGLEGIDAAPGRDALVEETPDGFARAVLRLLEDPDLQAQLGANGRRLAVSRYDWRVVLEKLASVYGEAQRTG